MRNPGSQPFLLVLQILEKAKYAAHTDLDTTDDFILTPELVPPPNSTSVCRSRMAMRQLSGSHVDCRRTEAFHFHQHQCCVDNNRLDAPCTKAPNCFQCLRLSTAGLLQVSFLRYSMAVTNTWGAEAAFRSGGAVICRSSFQFRFVFVHTEALGRLAFGAKQEGLIRSFQKDSRCCHHAEARWVCGARSASGSVRSVTSCAGADLIQNQAARRAVISRSDTPILESA